MQMGGATVTAAVAVGFNQQHTSVATPAEAGLWSTL